jgi:hypothetical protein
MDSLIQSTCYFSSYLPAEFLKLTYKFWKGYNFYIVNSNKVPNVERLKVHLSTMRAETRVCVWCAMVRTTSHQPSDREIVTTISRRWLVSLNGTSLMRIHKKFCHWPNSGWRLQYTSVHRTFWHTFSFPQLWPMLFILSATDKRAFPKNTIFCSSNRTPWDCNIYGKTFLSFILGKQWCFQPSIHLQHQIAQSTVSNTTVALRICVHPLC